MTFEPELGQMMFGQPWQKHELPPEWEECLSVLGSAVKTFTEGDNPASNTGWRHDGKLFSMHAYDWGDDEQPWNFKWRSVRVSWYKWLGRGTSANQELGAPLAYEMLTECLVELRGAP